MAGAQANHRSMQPSGFALDSVKVSANLSLASSYNGPQSITFCRISVACTRYCGGPPPGALPAIGEDATFASPRLVETLLLARSFKGAILFALAHPSLQLWKKSLAVELFHVRCGATSRRAVIRTWWRYFGWLAR